MHKKALECAKKTLEEFCAIGEPTCEQAELFKYVMCGFSEFVNAEYKAKIIDGMNEAEEEEKLIGKLGMSEMNDRMGYNRNRDAMGRFTNGNGRMNRGRRGFYPDMEMEDWYMDKYLDNPMMFKENMRSGYPMDGNNGQMSQGNTNGGRNGYNGKMMNNSRHGENYDMYREARRHYTETENPQDKEKMDKKAKETFHDSLDVFRELWREGDPTLRNLMRTDVQNFINNEMV